MAILLIADHDNASLKDPTLKALTAAAAMGGPVHVLVAGKGCGPAAAAAARLSGVEKVLVADDAAYEHQLAEPDADYDPTYTTASTPAVKVSLGLLQEASALRTRMLAVCEYFLGDQPEHAAELRDIRQGQGYQDLADDLARLAALYEREDAVVRQDTKYYRAGDDKQARTLAARILAEVAASAPTAAADTRGGKVPAAREAAYRAFAVLAHCYEEVAAAGRYLLRHEGGAELFCSLYSAGRRPPRPARPTTPEPSPAGA